MSRLTGQIKNLPEEPGIYIFKDNLGKILYVGKSISVKKRVSSYFHNKNLGPKTNLMVGLINSIDHIKVFSEFEALLLEAELIRQNQPFFNSVAKDDKSPIYIKITAGAYPTPALVRRPKLDGEFIKGPYQSAKTARLILKMIRRIFPYCHHKNPRKPCLYVHLGLCPYPYESETARKNYLKSIAKIKELLNGQSQLLLRQLTAEMQFYSREQKFEEAARVKDQIKKIQDLSTTFHAPSEFLQQPTLVDDLTLARLKDLQKVLDLKKLPRRIECYDISNIGGKLATGSMVVFTSGVSDKSQYRRFKIKFSSIPNDYEMLREVLTRRIKNNWPKPDLIIIDGGRGQLNSCLAIANKYKYVTAMVSLAKRLEEIYTPQGILPLRLPKESPARQLAQTIRDEAHRFAITYHRLLRSKLLLGKT